MTTTMMNPTIQENLNAVNDTLYDIKCLTKLYRMLQQPCNVNKRFDESYDNFKDIDLVEIGQALISVLDMQRLFPLLNNLTISGTDSLSGIIVLVSGDEVQVKASYGLSHQVTNNAVFRIGDGAIGCVVKQGTPVIINNVENDSRFNKQQFKWYHGKTLLCVPIKSKNRVAGVISVSGKRGGDVYTDNDLLFLETLAVYAAIAIEKANFCDKLKKPDKLSQLTSSYYNENVRYLPVTLRSIKIGAFTGCDLYLQTTGDNETRYLLYCKGSKLFEDERKELFVKKNISKIYVAKNGKAQYLRYIATSLEHVLRDEITALHEKAKVTYDVAVNIMTDMSKDTDIPTFIERSRDWTVLTLDLILKDQEARTYFMKLLNYDDNVLKYPVNVAILGLLFGYYMAIPANDLMSLGIGLLLQDIGKTALDSYWVNSAGRLTKEEMEQMRKHPDMGFIILSKSGSLPMEACLIAKQHHEQFNGNGYPEGLKGVDIHCYSRIARIVSEFVQQMSRIDKNHEKPVFQALQKMVKEMEGHFDKEILKKFIGFMHVSTSEKQVEASRNAA
ncbi:MAG: GAF domain-containing protein [Planctomycetes bacterium]|nr:GAF domain-containing protein [Planctomycetota bacterium]